MRILVVEDHPETRRMLEEVLVQAGYVVDSAGDLADARTKLEDNYDGLVLDWMLPDGAGLELCGDLRREGRATPILVLTARGDVGDRVAGLDAGADDYLRKPFAVAELLARLRAMMRRGERMREASVLVGAVDIRLTERRAILEGRDVMLTAREFSLLECLLSHDGRVVPRSTILRQVWEQETPAAQSSLEVLISRLRKKLSAENQPFPIRTHRGYGYSLDGSP